jgi:ATP-dependent helicase Lhr and Lhr-like helicase
VSAADGAVAPGPAPTSRSAQRQATRTLADWFSSQGWRPAAFQRSVWQHYLDGRSGLLHAPTGSGKTLAVWGGPLLEALAEQSNAPAQKRVARRAPGSLKVLWVTPLRALATDTAQALAAPLAGIGLDWRIELRTGDSGAGARARARRGAADVLVTTPESLSLLLSYPDHDQTLGQLRYVVVDEWHELLGSRRGVLLELALAQLRRERPGLRIWGLSATLGNLAQARDVLLPGLPDAPLVDARPRRRTRIRTLLPPEQQRFPWAGRLGLGHLPRVLAAVLAAPSSLVFTNTRNQAELWHQALAAVWPLPPEQLALHHGSLSGEARLAAEQGLRAGTLRCVVATSSLDLGVDFPAVEQVIQVGSPKGASRLLQRAGRAAHRPGGDSEVLCVPTHAFELIEFAAARQALDARRIESRAPLVLALDVLAQHLVSRALGGGFEAGEALAEARSTHAFAALDDDDWQAVLDFVVRGGSALQHYPDFVRVQRDGARYVMDDRRQALRHRMSIGTILGDSSVQVKLMRGGHLGSVEEAFISRMKPGESFRFAGRNLVLVRLDDMVARVRTGGDAAGAVPRWMGGRMPLSSELSAIVRQLLPQAADAPDTPELHAAAPMLRTQREVSHLPGSGELLVEAVERRGVLHLAVHAFAGRSVHDGLASLVAWRLARLAPNSFGIALNDYGFMLTAGKRFEVDEDLLRVALSPAQLVDDLREAVNLAELARRQFREIARVAGLLPPSMPGKLARSMRQLQASSGLLYDVLRRHDPGHVLLAQAEREALATQLDLERLQATLARSDAEPIVLRRPRGFTPLSFALWAEWQRGALSNEDWRTRVERAAQQLERRHGR